VYLVGTGSLSFVTRDGADVVPAGASVFVGDNLGASVVAIADSTIVAIAAREWRALRALAPGVVTAVETGAIAPTSSQTHAAMRPRVRAVT
jgi:hypothetical protein